MNYIYSSTCQTVKSRGSQLHKASEIRQQTGLPERTQITMITASVRRSGAEHSDQSSKLHDDTVEKMINTLKDHYKRRILS
jgi:hypothetical protein